MLFVLLVIVSLTAYSISTDMQSNYVGCYLYFVVIRCSCAKADGADFLWHILRNVQIAT